MNDRALNVDERDTRFFHFRPWARVCERMRGLTTHYVEDHGFDAVPCGQTHPAQADLRMYGLELGHFPEADWDFKPVCSQVGLEHFEESA
ncbi:MAG: hypothetical protein HYS81_00600 [Candidatus Aenigmatarchaeota archaeon]|nr:MAG: hypothetical protein HYS81_00600 [Candidatus Aenigmarchaeota archaeon]